MEAKNPQENPKLLRFQTFFSLDLLKSICAKIWILVRYLYVFLKGDLLYYASSLSFYTIFALLPMLLIVFSLVAAMPEFKENLERRTGLEVIMWDERLSTVSAHKAMMEAGVRREDRDKYVDSIAATIILQGYLDSISL